MTGLKHKVEYWRGDLRFYVYDDNRAVQFVATLGFGFPPGFGRGFPEGTDLGYHSPEPRFDGHTPMERDCALTGGTCYYDGSTLNAEEPMRILREQGDDALWSFLEAYWHDVFDDGKPGGFGEAVASLKEAIRRNQ